MKFGKKDQTDKAQKPTKKLGKKKRQAKAPDKPTKQKYVRPYKKVPLQAKQAYIPPILLLVGVSLVGGGLITAHHNSVTYKNGVMASSMTKGEPLVSWGRETDANLTMGNSRLSKDGKTLAVEIKYDEGSHNALSSFGNKYKLRLITPEDNPMTGTTMSYGMFGTDGSGVLTIHSKHGFKDKAFVVMLIDNGKLLTSADLTDNGDQSLSDDEIDDSITAQLSGDGADSSSDGTTTDDKKDLKQPPIYYVRLNANHAKRVTDNWHNDRDIVDDLFVNQSLRERKKDMHDLKTKLDRGKSTIAELDRRLEKNPDDDQAQSAKDEMTSTVDAFQRDYDSAKQSYDKIKNSNIQANVLEPKVTTYERFLRDLNILDDNSQ